MFSPSRTARLRSTSPKSGTRLQRDPETPAGLATLPLTTVVDPASEQVRAEVPVDGMRVARPGSDGGRLLGIEVLDHVLLDDDGRYCSLKERVHT